MSTLGVVLARNHPEQRLFDKNKLEIAEGLTCCGRVIDILHSAASRNAGMNVIISTNDESGFKPIAEKHGADIVVRQKYAHHVRHEPIVTETIELYEAQRGKRYDQFAVIWGIAVFIRPSWIRESIRALREEEYIDCGITHIMPAERPPMVICLQRMNPPPLKQNLVFMKHKGAIVDIDDKQDLEDARAVFKQCAPDLNETYHDNKIDLTASETATGIWGWDQSTPRWLQVIHDLSVYRSPLPRASIDEIV